MQPIIAFISEHQSALSAVGAIILQEFFANASFIKGNSLGQVAYGWVLGKLQGNVKPPAPPQS